MTSAMKLASVASFTSGPPFAAPAPVAAGKIHSDMEKGFIRMEVIRYPDLIELGSEEAAARAGKMRLEGKEYLVRDGDVVVVRFSK